MFANPADSPLPPDGGHCFQQYRAAFAAIKLVDFDTARFIRFRNNALKVDIQQTVYQVGAANMNIFCELEFTLKVALSDALIQVGTLFLLAGVGAFYNKQIILAVISSSLSAKPATAIAMR